MIVYSNFIGYDYLVETAMRSELLGSMSWSVSLLVVSMKNSILLLVHMIWKPMVVEVERSKVHAQIMVKILKCRDTHQMQIAASISCWCMVSWSVYPLGLLWYNSDFVYLGMR